MARKPQNYWEKRQTKLMKRIEKNTEPTINDLISVYREATSNINKEIVRIYNNYGKDSGLTQQALMHLLNTRETQTHYNNLLKVIQNNIKDEDLKKKLLAKYTAPAYNYRISRFQELQDEIDLQIKLAADKEIEITRMRYAEAIKETYNRNMFDIQKGLGFQFQFNAIDNKTINLMLKEKWVDKGNFSTRIWKNNEKLGEYLKTQLSAASLSGKSVQKISSDLAHYMQVGMSQATTLVRTEMNHFANEAEMMAYQELDIEEYQFIATLDKVTCLHCAKLDKRKFKVSERKIGFNYPPIHPNDRCTTIAVLDDEVKEGLQRRAKDEDGNTIFIPQDMDYRQWKESLGILSNINKPQYIKSSEIRGNAEISKEIDKAIKEVSNKVYKMLIGTRFEKCKENCYYDRKNDIIYVSEDAGMYDIIHEIGHLIETKQKIMYNKTYIDIQKEGIGIVKKNEIKTIAGYPKQNGKDVLFIPERDKFLSEYQRRIYYSDINGKPYYSVYGFNTETLGDYFSEGYRYYILDKELVKKKDYKLYKFIKDLVE